MSIHLPCPECGKAFMVPDHYAGKRGRCPFCHAVVTVPILSSPGPAPRTVAPAPRRSRLRAFGDFFRRHNTLLLLLLLVGGVAMVIFFLVVALSASHKRERALREQNERLNAIVVLDDGLINALKAERLDAAVSAAAASSVPPVLDNKGNQVGPLLFAYAMIRRGDDTVRVSFEAVNTSKSTLVACRFEAHCFDRFDEPVGDPYTGKHVVTWKVQQNVPSGEKVRRTTSNDLLYGRPSATRICLILREIRFADGSAWHSPSARNVGIWAEDKR